MSMPLFVDVILATVKIDLARAEKTYSEPVPRSPSGTREKARRYTAVKLVHPFWRRDYPWARVIKRNWDCRGMRNMILL